LIYALKKFLDTNYTMINARLFDSGHKISIFIIKFKKNKNTFKNKTLI
jgi:hypothetical protein